jgi:FixJ family two-component response regulator
MHSLPIEDSIEFNVASSKPETRRATENETIFIVDDDVRVLKALRRLLASHGFDVRTYNSANLFLEEHDASIAGCVILDVAMPELSGLAVQERLVQRLANRMIIFLTGHGDITAATQAMRRGAVHFLTKPVDDDVLLDAVCEALLKDQLMRGASAARKSAQERFATLTPREREVMQQVVHGHLNKEIAGDLGTVEKTIKVHRARVMRKMGARSLADLVRIALRLES